MTSTLLTLSRHGQTSWHADNQYAGSSDVGLTDTGRQQAEALAGWAEHARPDAVVCSPQGRSRATAAPAARVLGVEPEVCADLREMHFGVAEGRTLDEVEQEHPGAVEAFRADPVTNAFAGSEPPLDVAGRVADTLTGLARSRPGAHLLVVVHNTAVRLGLCLLLGIACSHYRRVFPRIDNGALSVLRVPVGGTGPPALLALNQPLQTRRTS